jgi:hypothetical protein
MSIDSNLVNVFNCECLVVGSGLRQNEMSVIKEERFIFRVDLVL